ncbi:MAG: PQQ-binding-like beta-propeller repeat protein [Gammaproteobacteria bacterium]|nr:PQQ-binding-like beta-propeller repeat protein [Gammaproteobacteria bacterium]
MRFSENHRRAACAAGLTLLLSSSTLAQTAADDWAAVGPERLLAPEPGDWMSYRRTYDVTGFSPLTDIDRDTVGELRLVWAYTMRDNARWVATPIVANGLMYVAEGSGRVVAFDVPTGEVVWTHTRTYPDDISSSEAYPRHRGVSIYGDKIYWGTADSFVVALDARTGRKLWEVKTGDYKDGEGHAHPPLIADGRLFIGMSGGDFAARGKLRALDAETGELLWTLYTVPRAGEPGYETWTENETWPPLGGAAWNTISYDAELGLVYFSTGQPTPWTTASRGLGDSLYTNSVIAADAATGEIRWHFQLVPADEWDRSAYESMLVDLEIGGVMRRALIQTGKIGWGVVLDRATGEFLHAFRTAYDNTITGWTDAGRPIYDPKAIPAPEDVDSGKVFEICPHIHGARNLQAPSYSPITGLYYLGVNNSCMNAQVVTPEFLPYRGLTGVTYTASLAPGYDFVGEFVAFDPVTGERKWVWRPASGAPMTASALATAGGIVFGGTADRQLFALHSETGELLWQTRLNGDVSGAPVTFEVDGKQYLAVGAGGRVAPTTTLGRLVGVDVPQGTGVMWVFALPDEAPRETPRPARRDAPTRSASDGVFREAQAAEGEQLFAQECSGCHEAVNYTGENFAVKWAGGTLSDVYQDISLAMPPANPGGLTPVTYASIVAYFLSRSGYEAGDVQLPGDARQLESIGVPAGMPEASVGPSP